MSDIVERLRNTPNWTREESGAWGFTTHVRDRAPFEAADEIEKLRAENAKFAASNHAYLSDYQEARGEIEKLRKAILDALKLADLDAIKSFRKTLLMALREKE
jgi:hypothetical protein